MPTRGRRSAVLLDTSAALALLVRDHDAYETTASALADRPLGLSGHAAFETYSVLTRLPPPARLTPGAAQRLLSTNFPHTRHLSSEAAAELQSTFAGLGIAGGSVYDALVGASAREHGLTLATRDRRALTTYRQLGVDVEVLR